MKRIYEKYTTIVLKKILSTGPQNPRYIKICYAEKEQLEKFRTLICNSEYRNDDDDDNNNNNSAFLFNTGKKVKWTYVKRLQAGYENTNANTRRISHTIQCQFKSKMII
jgi:hypothetical protein